MPTNCGILRNNAFATSKIHVKNDLAAFLHSELNEDATFQVATHLSPCAECRADFEEKDGSEGSPLMVTGLICNDSDACKSRGSNEIWVFS